MRSAIVVLACIAYATLTGAQTSVSSVSVATATPSLSVTAGTTLPTQAALPPKQAWCPSEIFCPGALLQTVAIANLYPDDKTFVDKPTSKPAQQVLADFQNISSSPTYGEIAQFLDTDFKGEGLELEAVELANFTTNPAFLNNVTSAPILKAFSQTVHGYWTQLIRSTNASTLCTGGTNGCESSLIPLNHTFVVPGGRFREQYYWDSFWIIEGLIESELYDIVNGTLQNFMDELDNYGFIPNGGRIYCLNLHSLSRIDALSLRKRYWRYIHSPAGSTLSRTHQKELSWWDDNRSLQVQSASNVMHKVYHYSVNNTAPRPESYLDDYTTAYGLNETQKAALYAELASGAETGWDYTVRFFIPTANGSNDGLRSLDVRNTVPIDLNSILYRNHILLASLYGSSDQASASTHLTAAADLRAAILDLFWDSSKLAFYDYNVGTNARNTFFSAANFYPLWSGIVPPEILNSSTNAFSYFSSLNLVLNRYNGTFPSTFVESGQQWDAPNTWPPHQYIVLQALRALPTNLTSGALPTPSGNQSTFSLIPAGQLGLNETQLPGQPFAGTTANVTASGSAADINALNGTVINGGNATNGEGWGQALERELANRYMASAFCSWHATGGSIANLVPMLPASELNITGSVNNTGNVG
ncbi:hypothetical protein H0H92_013254 [Tricholoma furcatifolium]|nr:hypothetical protein H0H92_013254 [Tricholoma furcatifolium]